MKWHPASLMIRTWAVCFAVFLILPFDLVYRSLSLYGFMILGLFLAAFCIGSLLKTPVLVQRHAEWIDLPDFKKADLVIAVVAIIAIAAQVIELRAGAGFDLQAAYDIRNERSIGFINGTQSGSSLAFQIGLLTSPIGYIALAKELIFYEKTRWFRLALFGLGPLVTSALALGGRGPLLFAIVISVLALITRRFISRQHKPKREKRSSSTVALIIGGIVVFLISMNYFIEVFIVRAGGADATGVALQTVGEIWGVQLSGERAEFMVRVFGAGTSYLIFVFSWYLIQGMVICNEVFTSYDGPSMLGLYGNEIALAVARRLNSELVVDGFLGLNRLNAYGFVTSAFGTLYVDFWFFGIVVSGIWGYIAGIVYKMSRTSSDGRWLLVVPFFVQGIVFSLINTPIGLSNGFVTYFWLTAIFVLSKRRLIAAG